jgi:hypothetical protein
MNEPFKVLREILMTGNTHHDFLAMCDLLDGIPPVNLGDDHTTTIIDNDNTVQNN